MIKLKWKYPKNVAQILSRDNGISVSVEWYLDQIEIRSVAHGDKYLHGVYKPSKVYWVFKQKHWNQKCLKIVD